MSRKLYIIGFLFFIILPAFSHDPILKPSCNNNYYQVAKRAVLNRDPIRLASAINLLGEYKQLKTDQEKYTLLHHFCAEPQLWASEESSNWTFILLKCKNLDYLDSLTKDNKTPLMLAAQSGNLQAIHLLLFLQNRQNSAEIDAKDIHNFTALHYAILNQHTKIAKALISCGANANIKKKINKKAKKYIYKDDTNITPLMLAALMGNNKILSLILEQPKNYLNQVDIRGWTALHHAVVGKNQAGVALLLNSKINQNKLDSQKRSAYDIAHELKLDSIKYLFKNTNFSAKLRKTRNSWKKLELPQDPNLIIPEWQDQPDHIINR